MCRWANSPDARWCGSEACHSLKSYALGSSEMPSDRVSGRPPIYVMPELMPDTPENVTNISLNSPRREEWRFIKELEDTAPKDALKEPEEEK